MTLQWLWGTNPVKYNPNATCLLRLGLIGCNQCLLAFGQNITPVCYLDHFIHITQHWHKDEGRGRGWKTLQPLCYPCNLSGVFCVRLCWDLGMIQAMIDITSEHNISKNNRNQLFSAVLKWFHLAVTLRWSQHEFGVSPLWNQTPADMSSCVLGLGYDRFIGCACPKMWSQPFWDDLTLLWPWDDLTMTLG